METRHDYFIIALKIYSVLIKGCGHLESYTVETSDLTQFQLPVHQFFSY